MITLKRNHHLFKHRLLLFLLYQNASFMCMCVCAMLFVLISRAISHVHRRSSHGHKTVLTMFVTMLERG